MLFQSRYEQAEPLCLDISVCRIMNFSWNTKVTDTHTHRVILRALFGYIYSWKRHVCCCTEEWFNTVFLSQRGCFISSISAHLIRRIFSHRFEMLLCFLLCFATSGPPYTADYSHSAHTCCVWGPFEAWRCSVWAQTHDAFVEHMLSFRRGFRHTLWEILGSCFNIQRVPDGRGLLFQNSAGYLCQSQGNMWKQLSNQGTSGVSYYTVFQALMVNLTFDLCGYLQGPEGGFDLLVRFIVKVFPFVTKPQTV